MSRSSNQLIIRKYGLLEPSNWGPDCEHELFLMNKLWNCLVELHRRAQQDYLSILMNDLDFAEATDKLRKFSDSLPAMSKGEIQTSIPEANPGPVDQLTAAFATLKRDVAVAGKRARAKAREPLRTLEESRRAAVKRARQTSGLWWGNYNAVVNAFEQARRTTLRRGGELKFKRYDGSGRFTNQLKRNVLAVALFEGSNSQVKIGNMPTPAWQYLRRGERKRLQRTSLTATIYTRDGERRTVTWPMIMHRPLPPDCKVTRVVITRRKIGLKWRWNAVFTAQGQLPLLYSTKPALKCAINLGWRVQAEGIRVATIILEGSPSPQFIVVPLSLVTGFSFLKDLRERRSAQRREILSWLRTIDFSEAPSGLATRALDIKPNSAAHIIASLAVEWRTYREWEPASFSRLEVWRRDDKRLLLWEDNYREKLINRRNDLFRREVSEHLVDVNHVILQDIDLAKIAGNNDLLANPNTQRYRIMASPSTLRAYIMEFARRSGSTVQIHEAVSTWRCNMCSAILDSKSPSTLRQTCSACGAVWDQDVNACRIMLKSTAPLL